MRRSQPERKMLLDEFTHIQPVPEQLPVQDAPLGEDAGEDERLGRDCGDSELIGEGDATLTSWGAILSVSRRLSRLLEVPAGELTGMAMCSFVSPADMDLFHALIAAGLKGHSEGELTFRTESGAYIPAYVSSHAAPNRTVKIVVTDLTCQKQNEEIVASEKLARAILDQAGEGIVVCNEDGQIIRASQFIHELCGSNPIFERFEQALPLSIASDGTPFRTSTVMSGTIIQSLEVSALVSDGRMFSFLLNASPLMEPVNRILGCVITLTDITERKKAEQWLRQSRDELEARVEERTREIERANIALHAEIAQHRITEGKLQGSREQLRALTARLQQVREEERKRMAREIHDELGQALTGLKMDLSWLERKLVDRTKEAAREDLVAQVRSMRKVLDRSVSEVQRISSELRPSVLDDFGLAAALEWQIGEFEARTGIHCTFTVSKEELQLDADLSTAVFRICQEALTNILRHAWATDVEILLAMEGDGLMMEVADNGRGIDANAIDDPNSLGLLGMRERALLFGGELYIKPHPNGGTIVTLRIPTRHE